MKIFEILKTVHRKVATLLTTCETQTARKLEEL